jgi:hypothetical protein
MTKKRLFIILSLVFILAAIPLTVALLSGNLDFRKEASSEGATFSFDPLKADLALGSEVDVQILFDSAGKEIVGADAVIAFDRTKVSIVDADPEETGVQVSAGSFFDKPLVLANKVEGNKIYLSINSFTPYQGGGIFGTIRIKARQNGPFSLQFVEEETKITEQGSANNIVTKLQAATFEVSAEDAGGIESSPSAQVKTGTDVDLNNDSKVNETDLQLFSKKLGAKTGIEDVDYNKDGQVNAEDFKVFDAGFESQKGTN